MPDIISHLELLVLNLSRQLLKYHWTTFYVNTIITHWQTKNIAPTREYRCSFFRNIHTALIHRIYLTWNWLYWTFQGVYEMFIESYFILVPPLLIINSKQLISGGQKNEQDPHLPGTDTISHLDLVIYNFTSHIWKSY